MRGTEKCLVIPPKMAPIAKILEKQPIQASVACKQGCVAGAPKGPWCTTRKAPCTLVTSRDVSFQPLSSAESMCELLLSRRCAPRRTALVQLFMCRCAALIAVSMRSRSAVCLHCQSDRSCSGRAGAAVYCSLTSY